MTTVIKRDSKKQRFDEKKIRNSIRSAAREAHMPEDKVSDLVKRVAKEAIASARAQKEVSTSAIRADILGRLDTAAPQAARAWRDFDQRTKGVQC